MAKMEYGSGFELVDPGTYRARIVNTFLHESEFAGKSTLRVLIEWIFLGNESGDSMPPGYQTESGDRTEWQFINAKYNQKNKKNTGTLFLDQIFGRELTENEVKEIDTDWFIGIEALVRVDHKISQNGNESLEFKKVTPREPVTIDSLKSNWEKAGSPKGMKPERFQKSAEPTPATAGSASSGW